MRTDRGDRRGGEAEKANGILGNVSSIGENPGILLRVRGLDEGDHPINLTMDAAVLEYQEFTKDVSVLGVLKREGERLTIDGEASGGGDFECTRCAEPFERVITAPLHLEFIPPRLESDPEDPNIHVYNAVVAAYVDITQDVRDALALAIPMKHLCRPDCKGLCPVCGKDLNCGTCDHTSEPETALQWAALKSLSERLRADESKGVAWPPSNGGQLDKPNPLANN